MGTRTWHLPSQSCRPAGLAHSCPCVLAKQTLRGAGWRQQHLAMACQAERPRNLWLLMQHACIQACHCMATAAHHLHARAATC